jgi:DNA-binding transcriptional ArsR family regulator
MADRPTALTSIEKALDVCEVLSLAPDGHSVSELARALKQPPATVHRLLAVLKRRGYVQQDEDTSRYRLALKMLDLSFRALGRSELRLHAYPALREHVLRSGVRAFLAVPRDGEVTYIWSTGPDAVAMHTVYGKQMPGHCSLYFDAGSARRLSCLKLERVADIREAPLRLLRFGDADMAAAASASAVLTASTVPTSTVPTSTVPTSTVPTSTVPTASAQQRLTCTCAPVYDYTGREVARVGLFAHDVTDDALLAGHSRGAWDLARLISLRLGSVAAHAMADSA